MYSKTIRIGFASWAVLLLAMASTATAQSTYSYIFDNGAGTLRWADRTNWGLNPANPLGVANRVPAAWFEEQALINSGQTITVDTAQTQLINPGTSAANSAIAAPAGVTVDGTTPNSKLNIASGGSLNVLITYGTGGNLQGALPDGAPTAGTGNATLTNAGAITVQPGGTLTVAGNIVDTNGTLTVGGAGAGGTVTAAALNAFTVNSAVSLLGSASVTFSNGAVLNGTTTITGPNVVFKTASINMSGTSVFSPVITSNAVAGGGGHSVINVAGGVSVNGTIRPQFSGVGVGPNLGDTWTLWDSALVQGTFTASDATGTGATLPTGLRYALTTTKTGSVNGVKGQLTVENFLTAQVDQATGQVTILNTEAAGGPGTGVTITGYQIASTGGALKPASFSAPFGGGVAIGDYNGNNVVDAADYTFWRDHLNQAGSTLGAARDPANGSGVVSQADFNSWKAHFGATGSASPWETVNSTTNSIAQLNSTSNSVVGLATSKSLGNVYDPVPLETTFGTAPVADLAFSYTRSDGRTVNAPVTYTGIGLANTLVLQVDPNDGKAKIINDSVFDNVKLAAYQITSASGSLLTSWVGLSTVLGSAWEKVGLPTTGLLAELNPNSSSNINHGQTLATMTGVFKTSGGTQDLVFQFLVPGAGAGTGVINGVVRYAAFSGAGANGSSAVPEPSSLILLALGGFATLVVRRRK